MQHTPFSQTTIGAIVVAIIAALAVYAVQRVVDSAATPSPYEASRSPIPGANAVRAE